MPITVKHCRWLISLIVLLALSAVMAVAAHAASSGDARFSGTIDSLTYTDLTREIRVHGWAWDAAANAPPITITIRVNGNTASASIKKVARPDVQAKLGTAAIDAGFSAIATLPSALVGGRHQAQVTAIFPDEQRMALLDWNSQPAELYVQKARVRHWILLAIILAAILAAYAPPVLDIGRRIGNRLASARKRLYVAITALFLILVSAGITGSSLPLLTNSEFGRAMVNTEDDSARIFRLRWIRADEWLVLSANVLAQWHHQPRFPIINTHLGIEGQNMGVVGMTGVPIAQAASIGRPATWGHFILPLRQALSWQWQLPFFGCLFALLWLLNSLRADRPIANLALALTFCTAPYAAAWSLWPLYATLFPALLLALLHKLATSSKTVPRLILGALAGLVLTGWVLVLYPPWQITVGTFCGLLTVGWWLDQQAPIRRRVSLILALLAGALICALLLGSWWIDTRDGVAQIRSTVYPGARDALQGGELGHLWALRGYINAESLTFGTGPWANTSETSSYFVLPVIMLWLGFWYSSRRFALCWTARACLAFIGFWMIFRFVGIPMWLAKLTLWSNVPSGRLDLSLGLACTVLIAVVGQRQASESATEIPGNWWSALILSVASTGLIVYGALSFPKEIFPAISVPFIVAVAAAGFFMSWWLLRGRTDAAIGLCLLLSIISSVGFNPIHRAPQTVEMTEATSRFTLDKRTGEPFRTLTIGGGSMSAMTLAAVGVPVVNGTLYYPHRSMWTALGLGAADWPKVNRYQHLAFELANIPQGVPYQIAHELDQVRISVDPRRFNFALTGAKRVIATGNDVSALRTSPTLQEIGTQDQWVWFAVNDNRLE